MQTFILALTVFKELIDLVKFMMTYGAKKKEEAERKALSNEINKAVDESDKDLDNTELAKVFDPSIASRPPDSKLNGV